MRLVAAFFIVAALLGNASCTKFIGSKGSNESNANYQSNDLRVIDWSAEQLADGIISCENYHSLIVTVDNAKTAYCECLVEAASKDFGYSYFEYSSHLDQVFKEMDKQGRVKTCRLEAGLSIDPGITRWDTQYLADETIDKAVFGVTGQTVDETALFYGRRKANVGDFPAFDLYRRPFAGNGWKDPTLVASNVSQNYFFYETFASGTSVVSWNTPDNTGLFLTYLDPATKAWSTPQQLGTEFIYSQIFYKDVSVDSKGNIAVSWTAFTRQPNAQTFDSYCFFQFFHSSSRSWSPTVYAPQSLCDRGQISWGTDGRAMIMLINRARMSGARDRVEYSFVYPDGETNFQYVYGITSLSDFHVVDVNADLWSNELVMTTDGNGGFVAAWVRLAYDDAGAIISSELDVGRYEIQTDSWQVTADFMTSPSEIMTTPYIVANQKGEYSLVWTGYNTKANSIYTSYYAPQTGWTKATLITSGEAKKSIDSIAAALMLNKSGEVSYSWMRAVKGGIEIWTAYSRNGKDYLVQKISDTNKGGLAGIPVATVLNDGIVIVSWEQGQDELTPDLIGYSILNRR